MTVVQTTETEIESLRARVAELDLENSELNGEMERLGTELEAESVDHNATAQRAIAADEVIEALVQYVNHIEERNAGSIPENQIDEDVHEFIGPDMSDFAQAAILRQYAARDRLKAVAERDAAHKAALPGLLERAAKVEAERLAQGLVAQDSAATVVANARAE
jgi:regulator of replication initiation timing